MKCDVCGCKVSKQDVLCPNCGYQLKKEIRIETAIYEDLKDHGIEKKKITLLDKIELHYFKSRARIPNVKMILIVFGLVVGLTLFNILGFFDNKTNSVFETVLAENGDDSYHTLKKTIEYRDTLLADYGHLKLVNSNEVVNDMDEYIETVSNLEFDLGDQNFILTYIYRKGIMEDIYIETKCQIGLNSDQFPFEEMNVFSSILGYESIADEFNRIKVNQPLGMYYYDEQLIIREEYVDYDSFNVYYKIVGKNYKIN